VGRGPKNANAFVYFATAQSSTTTFSVLWAAGLEKRGVPGVTVIFDFFSNSAQEKREMLGTMLRIVTAPGFCRGYRKAGHRHRREDYKRADDAS
jgi:hypothetical protein